MWPDGWDVGRAYDEQMWGNTPPPPIDDELLNDARRFFEQAQQREEQARAQWRSRDEQERLFRERYAWLGKRCYVCGNREQYCTCGRARASTRCPFCSNMKEHCSCKPLHYPNAIETTCTEEQPCTDIVLFTESVTGQRLHYWQRRLLIQMMAEERVRRSVEDIDFTKVTAT